MANSETQVKSRILSNAEKEIISSTTEAWSNVMFTCKKKKKKHKNMHANMNGHLTGDSTGFGGKDILELWHVS
jgi:hypothetical protein